MELGKRVYRVEWSKGIPFIETGKIVAFGMKKKQPRVKIQGQDATKPTSDFHHDIKTAIEHEICFCAMLYGGGSIWLTKRQNNPWQLVNCIAELNRLYQRLRKHHLC